MIVKNAEIVMYEDKDGHVCFNSKVVDLDKTSLVVAVELEGGMGTLEFKRKVVILHPPNGEIKRIAASEFKKRMEEDFENFPE